MHLTGMVDLCQSAEENYFLWEFLMVHLTLGSGGIACARVTLPEGILVLACGALATPTESPPQTIPGEGTMLTCTGKAIPAHRRSQAATRKEWDVPRTRVHLGRASAGACKSSCPGPGVGTADTGLVEGPNDQCPNPGVQEGSTRG